MTQKKKEAVKHRFLRRSQGTEEVVLVSDSNQNLMICSKAPIPQETKSRGLKYMRWKSRNPEGQGREAGPFISRRVVTPKRNYLVIQNSVVWTSCWSYK